MPAQTRCYTAVPWPPCSSPSTWYSGLRSTRSRIGPWASPRRWRRPARPLPIPLLQRRARRCPCVLHLGRAALCRPTTKRDLTSSRNVSADGRPSSRSNGRGSGSCCRKSSDASRRVTQSARHALPTNNSISPSAPGHADFGLRQRRQTLLPWGRAFELRRNGEQQTFSAVVRQELHAEREPVSVLR
jgi:hypothetical protein